MTDELKRLKGAAATLLSARQEHLEAQQGVAVRLRGALPHPMAIARYNRSRDSLRDAEMDVQLAFTPEALLSLCAIAEAAEAYKAACKQADATWEDADINASRIAQENLFAALEQGND